MMWTASTASTTPTKCPNPSLRTEKGNTKLLTFLFSIVTLLTFPFHLLLSLRLFSLHPSLLPALSSPLLSSPLLSHLSLFFLLSPVLLSSHFSSSSSSLQSSSLHRTVRLAAELADLSSSLPLSWSSSVFIRTLSDRMDAMQVRTFSLFFLFLLPSPLFSLFSLLSLLSSPLLSSFLFPFILFFLSSPFLSQLLSSSQRMSHRL